MKLSTWLKRFGKILRISMEKFSDIDGTHRAAAFAYYAFFSLFPVIVLVAAIGSLFFDRHTAAVRIITYLEGRIPLDAGMKTDLFDTIGAVVDARGQAGWVALVVAIWGASQFLEALICAVNRAWGREIYDWWKLPLHGLASVAVMVGALLLSVIIPTGQRLVLHKFFPMAENMEWTDHLARSAVPFLIMLATMILFYKLAPRRIVRYRDVWVGALLTCLLLRGLEKAFVIYLKLVAGFNAVYGVFGGLMALLMWIYVAGCIIIIGACLSAAQMEVKDSERGLAAST